ncbi:MAG: hypothetical protein ABI277_15305 [Burkholderiaceae bacterium]
MRHPALALLAGALALCAAVPAHAVGQLVDVQVVDRDTGETLTPIRYKGDWWIAGKPGARYGVTLLSRSPQRTLNVVAVDGVNAISGDTAAWNQTGYVLSPYQRTQIDGWRKDMNRIAAFAFTTLPDSYAARTGRPADVGVIGIATFSEKPRPAPTARPHVAPGEIERSAPAPQSSVSDASNAPAAKAYLYDDYAARRESLGTGHGEIEQSSIGYVGFNRAQSAPNEIVTIHYDRAENLIAMGIMPSPYLSPVTANPFPGSGRFVADPPPR